MRVSRTPIKLETKFRIQAHSRPFFLRNPQRDAVVRVDARVINLQARYNLLWIQLIIFQTKNSMLQSRQLTVSSTQHSRLSPKRYMISHLFSSYQSHWGYNSQNLIKSPLKPLPNLHQHTLSSNTSTFSDHVNS